MIAFPSSYLNNLTPDNRVLFRVLRSLTGQLCFALITLTIPATFASTDAQAEIYQCGETWTNQPCPGVAPVFPEKITTPRPVILLEQQKRDAIHQLTSWRYNARDRFGVDLDARDVEQLCELETTTLEQCRMSIENFRTRLDSRVIEHEKLQLRRREIELAEQRGAGQSINNSQVIVIDNAFRGTPTAKPGYPPYNPPNSGLIHQPQAPQMATAPSRGQVPSDARIPLPRAPRR